LQHAATFSSIVTTPEEFAVLSASFDEAWTEIEARRVMDPLAVPGEREMLGHIITTM
jgi:hypothetical protein